MTEEPKISLLQKLRWRLKQIIDMLDIKTYNYTKLLCSYQIKMFNSDLINKKNGDIYIMTTESTKVNSTALVRQTKLTRPPV